MDFDNVLINIAIKYKISYKEILKLVLNEKQITIEQVENYIRKKILKKECQIHRINIFSKKDIIECYQCNTSWKCNECINSNKERFYKYKQKEFYIWKQINCSECNMKYYELICIECHHRFCNERCSLWKNKLLNNDTTLV